MTDSSITRPVLRVRGARCAVGRVEYWTRDDLEYELTTPRPVRAKIDAPGWLPVRMRDGETRRKSANVAEVWALVCDLDDDLDGWESLVERVASTGRRAILHTTWSHTPEAPRERGEVGRGVGEWRGLGLVVGRRGRWEVQRPGAALLPPGLAPGALVGGAKGLSRFSCRRRRPDLAVARRAPSTATSSGVAPTSSSSLGGLLVARLAGRRGQAAAVCFGCLGASLRRS